MRPNEEKVDIAGALAQGSSGLSTAAVSSCHEVDDHDATPRIAFSWRATEVAVITSFAMACLRFVVVFCSVAAWGPVGVIESPLTSPDRTVSA